MDNEFNKDLLPEEETSPAEETVEEAAEEVPAEETVEEAVAETEGSEEQENIPEETEDETSSKAEEEFAARIEKRFSKYPNPSDLEKYAITKAQKKAFADYAEAYESYSQADSTKEKRLFVRNLNSLLYSTDMSGIVVAFKAENGSDAAAAAVAEAENLKKKGKIASIIFLAVFLLVAVIFTVVKVLPNIDSISDLASHGLYFVSFAIYIALSIYAASEIKNLFASMGNAKARKALPMIDNIPIKLEGADLAEVAETCITCGEKPQAEGSDYCEECRKKLLSTKIPFLGWVAGAGVLVAAVISFVILFFTAAPAFYGMSAEIAAKEKRWDDAIEHYSQMTSTVSEFSSYLSPDSFIGDILKISKDTQADYFRAYANAYGPIQAVQSASYIISDTSILETDKSLAPYMEVYQRYFDTATVCSSFLESAEEDYDLYVEALTKALNEEGVDKSIIYYTLFGLANNEGKDLSVQLDYLAKTEEYAKEMGYDYTWLYGFEYAAALKKAGEYEKALGYYDALIEINKNDWYSCVGKAKCLISLGKTSEAESFVEEIKKANDSENEFTYAIEALILRTKGDYDAAINLCTTVLEEHQTSAELHHQLALSYLLNGDYDKAYEHANNADYNGIYWAQYGLTKAYSFEYLHNLFLTANLCIKNSTASAKDAEETIKGLESYGEYAPEIVEKIVNGEVKLEDILMKGAYDIL